MFSEPQSVAPVNQPTYCFVKIHQAELIWFGEELRLVHEADVENDVGSFLDLSAFDGVVCQSFSHGEINHWMKPQRLVDETLQHVQALVRNASLFSCKWKCSIDGDAVGHAGVVE